LGWLDLIVPVLGYVFDQESEETSTAQFTLLHQNKGLTLELMSSKRSIAEARKELELMRRKSREMESLVSLIQRAWSQLDIDASLVLDSLGDNEEAPICDAEHSGSQLLQRLLHVHERFTQRDPTDLESQPRPDIDQWSSDREIDQEKKAALEEVASLPVVPTDSQWKSDSTNNHQHHNESESTKEQEEDSEESLRGGMEAHLSQHVQFTLSLLERVCFVVNEGGVLQQNVEVLRALAMARESQAKILFLNDSLTALRSELVAQETQRKQADFERNAVERKLDKAVWSLKDMETRGVRSRRPPAEGAQSGAGTGTGTGSGEELATSTPADALQLVAETEAREKHFRDEIVELQKSLSVVERQLVESETAKAKAEMTLTERLSRPLSQTETQIADMRRAMEELRAQCKQRVAALVTENETLQVVNLNKK
jgi:hypothetical protein